MGQKARQVIIYHNKGKLKDWIPVFERLAKQEGVRFAPNYCSISTKTKIRKPINKIEVEINSILKEEKKNLANSVIFAWEL